MLRPAAVALLSALVCVLFSPAAFAAGPLFPTPLHLTRQVHDPITNTTAVLEEYGQGDRLVSVRGTKTSIADYTKGELMEIDRDAGTYSITRFDAIARARQIIGANTAPVASATTTKPRERQFRSNGMRATKLGRNAEFFETDIEGNGSGVKAKLEVAVDPTALVSKNALEVLLGAAYPGVRRPEHDAVLSAAASPASSRRSGLTANAESEAMYALPIEQSVRYEAEGQSIELRTSVVRIGSEVPPADQLSIPAGARLVVSRLIAASEEIERLDRPTPTTTDRH